MVSSITRSSASRVAIEKDSALYGTTPAIASRARSEARAAASRTCTIACTSAGPVSALSCAASDCASEIAFDRASSRRSAAPTPSPRLARSVEKRSCCSAMPAPVVCSRSLASTAASRSHSIYGRSA